MNPKAKHWIIATLVNDESSTDSELVRYFMDNGLREGQARKLVAHRNYCLRRNLTPTTELEKILFPTN